MGMAVNNKRRFAALDFEAHFLLAKFSKNCLIHDLIAMIRGQLKKALQQVLLLPDAIPSALEEHVTIYDAIKRRDPGEANAAMQNHLKLALTRYIDSLK